MAHSTPLRVFFEAESDYACAENSSATEGQPEYTRKSQNSCVCAENTSAIEAQPGNTRKSQDSRPGGQASLATIDSLASSIEERKISDGSSLPPSSLPQPLTPRTAALLQRVSEAAAGRQGSRLKPTDGSPAESSGEMAPPVLGAAHSKMELHTPEQGNFPVGDSAMQTEVRKGTAAQIVEGFVPEQLAEAEPAQSLDSAPTHAGGDATLDHPGAALPETPSAKLTASNGVEHSAPRRDQAQAQASSQKRPAKAAASSLEEHQPQSPKRYRTSGKSLPCTIAFEQSLTRCIFSASLLSAG